MIRYKRYLKSTSKKLRRELTLEESILWEKIRRNQILGVRFYRQKPLNGYIVDFYAPKINLVIELDVLQHSEKDNIEYDSIRTKILFAEGIVVKRFSNNQIRKNLDLVLKEIYQHIHFYTNIT